MTHELPNYPGEMPPPPEKKPETLSKREAVALEMLKVLLPQHKTPYGGYETDNAVSKAFWIADYFLSYSK